jgi:hypothetical protein
VSTDEVYGTLGPTGAFHEETPYAPNVSPSPLRGGLWSRRPHPAGQEQGDGSTAMSLRELTIRFGTARASDGERVQLPIGQATMEQPSADLDNPRSV